MSFLLLSGVASLGYWLNRNGRGSRLTPQNIALPPRDRPNGPNVYQTDRVQEVNNLVKDMAGSRYPQPQSFGPNPFAAYEAQVGAPISQLTGLPMDMSHGNMQPHFGAVKRQISGSADTRKLEMFAVTGAEKPPVKTETLNASLTPQNRAPVLLSDAPDQQNRVRQDLSDTRADYQLPQIRQARDIGADLRIAPKSGDELRAANNPMQAEYQNVLLGGKLGDKRPLIAKPRDNPYDYTSMGNSRAPIASVVTRGQSADDLILNPTHLLNQDRHRDGREHTNFGPAVGPQQARGQADRNAVAAAAAQRPDLKREFRAPSAPYGGAARIQQGAMGTKYTVATTKRDQCTNRIQAPSSSIQGAPVVGILEIDATSRDSLADRSGHITRYPQVPQSRTTYSRKNFDLPMTAREMNADNMRFGPAHSGLNLPAMIEDYDIDANSKEQIVQDNPHYGNPTSSVRRGPENGEWTQDMEIREHGNRMSGGFAPLGQASRDAKQEFRQDRSRDIGGHVAGSFNAALGSGKRTPFATSFKTDVKQQDLAQGNRTLNKPNGSPSTCTYPVITKAANRETMDNRMLITRPDATLAREFGRLRPILGGRGAESSMAGVS